MSDIDTLNNLVNEITDVEKLDTIYNEVLLPRLKMMVARFKKKSVDIRENCSDFKIAMSVKIIMDSDITLADLVNTTMRPYLVKKGYKINAWSSGTVTISWE